MNLKNFYHFSVASDLSTGTRVRRRALRFRKLTSDEILFGIFLAFIFALPFTKVSIPAIGLFEFTFADLCVIILFLINVFHLRKLQRTFRIYLLAFVFFVFTIALNIVVARSLDYWFKGIVPYAFSFMIMVTTFTFFSGDNSVSRLRAVRTVIGSTLFVSAVPAYLQLLGGGKNPWFYDAYGWRYSFLSQNPNQYGVYVILFFFLLTIISLKYFPKTLSRVLWLQLFCLPAILFCGSRTAIFAVTLNAVILGTLSFLSLSTVRKVFLAPVVLVVLLMSLPKAISYLGEQGGPVQRALAIFDMLEEKGGDVLDSKSASGGSIAEGKRLFVKYPLLGVGLANKPMHSRVGTEIHNTFIKLLAESGLVGFSGFIFLFLLPLLSMLTSSSSLTVKLTSISFYLIFIAMNWPHMLFRQRWVWAFMLIFFVCSRIKPDGTFDRSRLAFLN